MNHISFKLKQYITNLILPKCVLAYGPAIASVYLQLAINIDNKQESITYGKTWIGKQRISINTGYSVRTITDMLDKLQSIGLILKGYKGRLITYELLFNDLIDIKDVRNFNEIIENKLLEQNENKEKLKTDFLSINNLVLNNINCNPLNKIDINLLRKLILATEKVYKGCSLFIVNFLTDFYDFNNDNQTEEILALKNGNSQSTINRYMKALKNINIINYTKLAANKPIKINFNIDYLNKIEQLEGNNMEVSCPICNKKFDDFRNLNIHLSKSISAGHKLLYHLKKQHHCYNAEELNLLYKKYENDFKELIGEEELKAAQTIEPVQAQPTKTKVAKPKNDGPKSSDLVKYYYGLTKTKCPSWAKECSQVKSYMLKLTIDEIKIVMDYMNRRGYEDLRFFSSSINDALLQKQYIEDLNKEGTEAYLVKKYYVGINQKINPQTLVRDVRKVKEVLNNGLTYEQTNRVIEYMVQVQCPSINFISNQITKATLYYQQNGYHSNQSVVPKNLELDDLIETILKSSSSDEGKFIFNGITFKQGVLSRLRDDIIGGRVNINKLKESYKPIAQSLAQVILIKKLYSKDYKNQNDWKQSIGLM